MNKNLLCIVAFLASFVGQSQLVVDTTQSPSSIVENVFLANGIFVSNITFNGGDATAVNPQVGTFDASATNLAISSGIVMATGEATIAVGPNNNTSATSMSSGTFGGTDPDLIAIAGINSINDWAILEFDFIATGDSLAFQYIFGSEEYQEFVNSSFNDNFAFFLSGPGIAGTYSNGAVNIALIPGTTDPVSINTVNAGLNSAYYYDNEVPTSDLFNSIQYDGMTTPLMACIGQLSIGEVYHIKLAIANVADGSYESGVFLGGDSFQQFCTETVDAQGSSDRGGSCMLSDVRSHVNYTETCGIVEFVNTSEVNLAYNDTYYEINGTETFDAEGTVSHTFPEAGTYNVKLVYEYNGFRAKFTLNPVVISLTAPENPLFHATGSLLSLENYDGTSEIQWFLNGNLIEGATQQEFNALENGDYSVTVNNGCPASSDVQNLQLGLGELASRIITVYPNPNNGSFILEYPSTGMIIKLYNSFGQLVKSERFSNRLQVELPASGVYMLQLIDIHGNLVATRKVISK